MIKNPFSKNRPSPSVQLPDWLSPLPEAEPCGPNLEYDAHYAVLISSMTPKGDAQYGNFIGTTEAPNWAEVERDCRQLLLRSRDITLSILFLRCRTRLAQADGLREGLTLLVALLEQYSEQLHPQLSIDGEFDPAVRANALAALTDPEGLLADIRDIAITKSSAMRLQVRDVERAHAVPRPVDALPLQAVRQQLDDLRRQQDSHLAALTDAVDLVEKLHKLVIDDLGDAAPDLHRLTMLMRLFNAHHAKVSTLAVKDSRQAPNDSAEKGRQPLPATSVKSTMMDSTMNDTLALSAQSNLQASNPQAERQAALLLIQQSRAWFELHEPSSPVAVLLRQAEKMVGKRFTEVANVIPMELLQSWERE